jgi:YD repeat-containing protein
MTGLGTYDGIFHDHGENIDQWYVVQDALVFCGNLGVEESGSSLNTYYWRIYNLMGDPSLSPFVGVPIDNEISHDPLIEPEEPPSSVVFHLTAEPNSYVGLTKNGALIGSGLVGESGYAEIEVSGHGADGTARLCVTCQNRLPYRVDIPIVSAAAVGRAATSSPVKLCSAPNPFDGATDIRLSLSSAQRVSLRIHDPAGRLVRTILTDCLPPGTHRYRWDGRGADGRRLPQGSYFVRLTTDTPPLTRSWKMSLRR